ncbi:MAG: hypothetical protein PVJ60_01065 [Phycisphaerales bacterium]|jgi:hypothetical protein
MLNLIAQAAEPVINGLDVVKNVDAFYHNAWLKLIITVVLLGTLIGVVMPLIIQSIQSSSFDKTEKRLKDEIEQIKNETQVSIQREVGVLDCKFVEIQKNLENQIDKKARFNRAEFYGQMALSLEYDAKNKLSSFIFYITAAREFAILKHYKQFTEELNRAISVSKEGFHLLSETSTAKTKEIIKEIQKLYLEQIDELSEMLENQGVKNKYSEQLEKVREICENLTTVVAKPK